MDAGIGARGSAQEAETGAEQRGAVAHVKTCPSCNQPFGSDIAPWDLRGRVYCSRVCANRDIAKRLSFWTAERDTQLRALWALGRAARSIAEELGASSRSAVIGRAHRLGLSRPTKSSLTRKRKTAEQTEAAIMGPALYVPTVSNCSILALTPRSCRWPLGHPGDENFRFCGAPKELGKPYCCAHLALAYRVAEVGAERKRVNRLLRTGTYV